MWRPRGQHHSFHGSYNLILNSGRIQGYENSKETRFIYFSKILQSKSLTAIETQLPMPPMKASARHGCFWRTRYENVWSKRQPVNPRKWYLTWVSVGFVQMYTSPNARKNGTFSRSFWCALRTRSTFSFFLEIISMSKKYLGKLKILEDVIDHENLHHHFFGFFGITLGKRGSIFHVFNSSIFLSY